MRVIGIAVLLVCTALFATACGGPDNPEKALADACERQLEEVAEEESGTPTAKSSEERLDEVTIVECAGQRTRIVPDEAEDEDGSAHDGDGEDADAPDDPQDDNDASEGAPEPTKVELDPEARATFAETCGGCHALSDADTTGQVGPDLDDSTFDADGVEERIEEGAPGMPPKLLEGDEARGVAEYVAAAAGQSQDE